MELRNITFYAFNEHHRRIGQQLKDANKAKSLLDAARREIPIVDALLGMIPEVTQLADEDVRQHAFNCLMRDVHVFLALKCLERGDKQNDSDSPSQAQDPSGGEGSMRLRRFGTN
ncbi:MAG: hypothetical protein IPK83_22205 [Planctomycetes bacterium]|nr:hypothetical protein [Planctomycetota bacterium]